MLYKLTVIFRRSIPFRALGFSKIFRFMKPSNSVDPVKKQQSHRCHKNIRRAYNGEESLHGTEDNVAKRKNNANALSNAFRVCVHCTVLEWVTPQAVGLIIKTVVRRRPFILMQLGLVVAPLVANHAAFAGCDMALRTVPVVPHGPVRPGTVLGVAGVAGIRLVANHATTGIPGSMPFIPQRSV